MIISKKTAIGLAITLAALLIANVHTTSSTLPTSSVTYNHLKWITNRTQFPLEMSIPISSDLSSTSSPNEGGSWDWLRLHDNKFVSKMDDLMKNYLVSETNDKANLVVLNYNNRTHEQLGSYEPRFVRKDGSDGANGANGERVVELVTSAGASNKRDIFTLAYLKDHYMKTEKFPDRIKVTCIADFLIANTSMTDTVRWLILILIFIL